MQLDATIQRLCNISFWKRRRWLVLDDSDGKGSPLKPSVLVEKQRLAVGGRKEGMDGN